jgi:hypothetical protein
MINLVKNLFTNCVDFLIHLLLFADCTHPEQHIATTTVERLPHDCHAAMVAARENAMMTAMRLT